MNPSVKKAIEAAEKRDLETRYRFIQEVCYPYMTSADSKEMVSHSGFNGMNITIPVVTDEEYETLKSLYPVTFSKISDAQPSFGAIKTIKNCVVFFTVLAVIEIIAGIIYLVASLY